MTTETLPLQPQWVLQIPMEGQNVAELITTTTVLQSPSLTTCQTQMMCQKCKRGLLIEARLSDAEMIAGNHFCDCAAGHREQRLAEYRLKSWQCWLESTKEANAKVSTIKSVIPGSPIPWTLENASLKGLRAKARMANGEVDPEKKAAINLAEILMNNEEIASKNKRNSMLLCGPPGVGKTGCLLPIFFERQRSGRDTYFVNFKHLMSMVRSGYKPIARQPTASEIIQRACSVDVLYFDDLGHTWEPEIKAHSVQIAWEIISLRHAGKKPTLMTSNLELNALAKQLTVEIVQRIAEMAVVVTMGGKILREMN